MSAFKLSDAEQKDLPDKVLAILSEHRGVRQAITGRRIAQRLGHKNDRKARVVIQQLIEDGHTIAASVSDPLGYYMVETTAEAEAYEKVLRSRAVQTFKRLRDFRAAIERAFGAPMQPILFDFDEEHA